MKTSDKDKSHILVVILVGVVLSYGLSVIARTNDRLAASQSQKPGITITVVPHAGKGGDQEMEKIAGTVSGVRAEDYVVVLFTHTDKWYVQPFIDSPYTSIDNKNKWESDTHLGREYAALLVKPSFKPPDAPKILPKVGDDVIAIATLPGK
jgi:hypothetical protein